MTAKTLIHLVKQKEAKMIQIRRDLHQIPELQLSLPQTVRYVCQQLDTLNIPYDKLVGGNAIVATIQGKETGKKQEEK